MKLMLIALIFSAPVFSKIKFKNWKHYEKLSFEVRQFSDDSDESTQDTNIAVVGETNWIYKKNNITSIINIDLKYDPTDNNRNLLNFKDVYILGEFETTNEESEDDDLFEDELGLKLGDVDPELANKDVALLFGFKIYHWTNMMKFSPADSVNTHINDGYFENAQKKGELTLSLTKKWSDSKLTGYLFPRIEKPFFPRKHSQASPGFNLEEPIWLKKNNNISDNDYSMQAGLRYEVDKGKDRYAIHFIRHTDTEAPLYVYDSEKDQINPYYFEVSELGFVSKINKGHSNYKLEAAQKSYNDYSTLTTIYGDRKPEDHMVISLGYDKLKKLKSKNRLKWYAEIQTVLGLEEDQKQEQYIYQADIFLGLEYKFKGKNRSRIFSGIIVDIERDGEQIFELSFNSKAFKKWKYETKLRMTNAPEGDDSLKGLQPYHNTNMFTFNLTYPL